MTGPSPETSSVTPHPRDALLEGLHADGARRAEEVRELHALLLRAARLEIGRRAGAAAHLRGESPEDLRCRSPTTPSSQS
jgi:hypothetical protein